MDILLDILKYTLPAVLVVFAVYLVLKQLFAENARQRRYEFLRTSAQLITPARLQAYERLTLLLERITPENMLTKLACSEMTAYQLQTILLETIRNEYEHNISQQLYVGNDVWIMVRNARESLLQLVNGCASQLPSDASGLTLAQSMIETYNTSDQTPVELALQLLKKEMQERLG
jgi:hypothetical protein